MTSEHVLVFWPLSGVKLQARVLNEETVWLTWGAITRKVTRFPSPGDNVSVEFVGSAADTVPDVEVVNAGSVMLATTMLSCCTFRSQVGLPEVLSRLAVGLSYTLCWTN